MDANIRIGIARELFHTGTYDGMMKSPLKRMKEVDTYLITHSVTDRIPHPLSLDNMLTICILNV